MSQRSFVMVAATYDSISGATTDFELLKAMRADGNLHRITAAIARKNGPGRARIHETTHTGKVATIIGFVGGAMLGGVASIPGLHTSVAVLIGAVVMAVIFGLVGHFAGGIPRLTMQRIAGQLAPGEAAIVVTALRDSQKDVRACIVHSTTRAHQVIEHSDMRLVMAELGRRVVTPGAGEPLDDGPASGGRPGSTAAPPPPWAGQEI